MGIPYSKQINAAFGQVTPLVAAGFEVLETTKNIAILLAFIQITTVFLLGFILAALIALLITVNPDLEKERKELVTPVIKWLAKRYMRRIELASRNWMMVGGCVAFIIAGSAFLANESHKRRKERFRRMKAGAEAEENGKVEEGRRNS